MEREDIEIKRTQAMRELANCYARVFGTEDGKRVLLDLQAKFSHKRPRFKIDSKSNSIDAALIDGQCNVLKEIEDAIEIGSPAGTRIL
jgi:hypothetical protein